MFCLDVGNDAAQGGVGSHLRIGRANGLMRERLGIEVNENADTFPFLGERGPFGIATHNKSD